MSDDSEDSKSTASSRGEVPAWIVCVIWCDFICEVVVRIIQFHLLYVELSFGFVIIGLTELYFKLRCDPLLRFNDFDLFEIIWCLTTLEF